ncbi:MAG: PID-CTERM protein-sorting domain-containing protein [Lutibacter sp.]
MNRKKVKVFLLCFGFMLFSVVAYSEKPPPVPEEGGAPPPPVGLPIDGGLSFLLISGVAYGIFELKRKK